MVLDLDFAKDGQAEDDHASHEASEKILDKAHHFRLPAHLSSEHSPSQ
jgi:hypothetical protein